MPVSKKQHLERAKVAKDDEYYTPLDYVVESMDRIDLQGKTIFLNCDSTESNIYKHLKDTFAEKGIKSITACSYKAYSLFDSPNHHYITYDGKAESQHILKGNGSFDSQESIELLKAADIVITNPPFSKMGAFIKVLTTYKTDFFVLLPLTAVSTAPVFDLLKTGRVRNTVMKDIWFLRPDHSRVVVSVCWLTSVPTRLDLKTIPEAYRTEYDPKRHLNYDCGSGVNTDSIKDFIGYHYGGAFGVPASHVRYDLSDFDLVEWLVPTINGKRLFSRILIKYRPQKA